MRRTKEQTTIDDGFGVMLTFTTTSGLLPEDLVVTLAKARLYELFQGPGQEPSVDRASELYLVHGV